MWNTIEKKWGESLMEKDYAEDHITLDSVIANAIKRKRAIYLFIQHETRERWKNTFVSGKNKGKIVEEYCNVSS